MDYSPQIPLVLLPIHIAGQRTADAVEAALVKLPFKGDIVECSATARASGGTSETLAIDVQVGTTSILSAPMDITAGAVTTGTLTNTVSGVAVADGAEISVDLDIEGTSPTWDDITVLLTLARK